MADEMKNKGGHKDSSMEKDCADCHHVHTEKDGSCSCGCMMGQKK